MIKNYLLVPFLALTFAASASQKNADAKTTNPLLDCSQIPTVTVLHPNCESPVTGTVTVTWPLGQDYEYSIDGVNYQPEPIFIDVLPGTYDLTYRTVSGCTSEPNTIVVDGSLAVATVIPTPDALLTSQIICINTAMQTITYAIGGAAESAVVSGLPAGVTGNFANGMLTISGTPTSSGVYNYTVTAVGGACPVVTSGTLTVRLNAAIVWMSSSGARNQTLCEYSALNPIRYMIANGATGAIADGLPQGLSGAFSGGIFTISGTAEGPGIYNYTVTTTGGCSAAVSTGTLVVNAAPLVNLECNPEGSDHDSLAFGWLAVQGATAYNYTYQIDGGPMVSGSAGANLNFTVNGVLPGQSVVFAINSVSGAVSCFSPQTVTCEMQPLSSDAFDQTSFAFYPNPVQHFLHLEHHIPFESVSIFDMVGNPVIDKKVSDNQVSIDFSGLDSGIYLVRTTTATGSRCFKIVKQ